MIVPVLFLSWNGQPVKAGKWAQHSSKETGPSQTGFLR
jgi:hypothetical protein